MHPKEQLQQDLKAAMKAHDTPRREVLRLLLAACKQVEVDKRIDLTPDDTVGILMSEAKKRREAIAEMESAGRSELAAQEKYELSVIESYLPEQLTRDEIEALAREAVAEAGATSPKDIGSVMKILMPKVTGQADGKTINAVVRDLLSQA